WQRRNYSKLLPKPATMVAVRMSVTSGMLRSSAFWQSSSTLITPPDKASRRLFETRSSRKSGTRLTASINEARPPASRRRDHPRRPDRAISAPPRGKYIGRRVGDPPKCEAVSAAEAPPCADLLACFYKLHPYSAHIPTNSTGKRWRAALTGLPVSR